MASDLTVHLFGLSDVGNRRETNEDAWWAGQLHGAFASTEKPGAAAAYRCAVAPVLAIVSDGVGGANAGETASQIAITRLPQLLAARHVALSAASKAEGIVRTALQAADAAIKKRALRPGLHGMCTTVSLLCVVGPQVAWWGHAGDSRIYRCRRGRLERITRDHSPVGRMCQAGLITEAEARRHPQRNQIDQSLGDPLNPFSPDVAATEVQPSDIYLLCSDGLSDGLWDHEIERMLANVQTAADVQPTAEELVAAAKRTSGRDNITAVLLLIGESADGLPAQPRAADS